MRKKPTKHQLRIMSLMLRESYELKTQCGRVFTSWFLVKHFDNDTIHGIDILRSTAENLLRLELIKYDKTDEYKHKYYRLTEKAKIIIKQNEK